MAPPPPLCFSRMTVILNKRNGLQEALQCVLTFNTRDQAWFRTLNTYPETWGNLRHMYWGLAVDHPWCKADQLSHSGKY